MRYSRPFNDERAIPDKNIRLHFLNMQTNSTTTRPYNLTPSIPHYQLLPRELTHLLDHFPTFLDMSNLSIRASDRDPRHVLACNDGRRQVNIVPLRDQLEERSIEDVLRGTCDIESFDSARQRANRVGWVG